jgi:hypothetical protein
MPRRIFPYLLITIAALPTSSTAQSIPKDIWGTWVIRRQLQTTTVACWGSEEAKKLLGTQLEYSEKLFRWNHTTVNDPTAEARTITGQEFEDENSGLGVRSTPITLQQLGIKQDHVSEVMIQHSPAHIWPETSEIPGDDVLLKPPDTIVFPVCNIYFEARRVTENKSVHEK